LSGLSARARSSTVRGPERTKASKPVPGVEVEGDAEVEADTAGILVEVEVEVERLRAVSASMEAGRRYARVMSSKRAHQRVLRSIVKPALGVSLVAGVTTGAVAFVPRAPFDPVVGCGGQQTYAGMRTPPPGTMTSQPVGMVPAPGTVPTASATGQPSASASATATDSATGVATSPPPPGMMPPPGFAPSTREAIAASPRPTRPTRRATDADERLLHRRFVV
jgi:hypothetical protein